jgi:hypothetical protein
MPDPNSIPLVHCSNCQALYQVVKAQAGPETVDLEIACRVCNGPLTAREGQFVLKYFLLREASRLDIRRAAREREAIEGDRASDDDGKGDRRVSGLCRFRLLYVWCAGLRAPQAGCRSKGCPAILIFP